MTNLRELLAKATPDYWYAEHDGDSSFVRSHNGEAIGEIWSNMKDTDAALICAARNALPGLLDKVERYEAALWEIRGRGKFGVSHECGKDVAELATKALEGAGHAE